MIYILRMKGNLMMKTLRELLDNRDNFVKNSPNDERIKDMTDLFVVYTYMTQKDINIDDAEDNATIILYTIQQNREYFDSLKDRVNNE